MFQAIKKALSNFVHNLLTITHHLFNTVILVSGIILCAFYSAPILPVLCYGFISVVIGAVLFNAAHNIVNFFSNMFGSPAEAPPVAASASTAATHRHTHSTTTHQVNQALEHHRVKTHTKASQTSEAAEPALNRAKTAVKKHESVQTQSVDENPNVVSLRA